MQGATVSACFADGLCDAMTSGKIWEQQNVKSKELESKYRWKLNDIGVSVSCHYMKAPQVQSHQRYSQRPGRTRPD